MQKDNKITRGLLIREPWIGMILKGEKDWEMRSNATKVRGNIALIAAGTGKIVGVARLVAVKGPMSRAEVAFNRARHRIPKDMLDSGKVDKWNTAWVLKDIHPFAVPIAYRHPQGAVIWVSLGGKTQRDIEKSLTKPSGKKIIISP